MASTLRTFQILRSKFSSFRLITYSISLNMRLPNQESPQNQAYIPFISLFRQQQYLIPPTATQHGHRLDPQFTQVLPTPSTPDTLGS